MPGPEDLHRMTASAAVDALRAREVRPVELVEASLARIEETDGALNAIPTLCPDRALDHARRIERSEAPAGLLAGLPIAVKDLNDVAGVRTTYGSPIYRDHVPVRSDLLVERLESNGAIVIGKSNTPEFGAGANTFNDVFGETRNPWDPARTAGGSSGGSAAALAAGQVWLATGSDLAGSLRTPASFCGVVGLRPSPGRVAADPGELPFETLSVEGPMGRTAHDVALMLDAMTGSHPSDPRSLEAPAVPFTEAITREDLPRRVAFSADLGGITPVDAEVAAICRAAAERLADLGADVDEASPDLSGAPEVFQVLRAASFEASLGPLYDAAPERLKPDIRWNVELGRALTVGDVGEAERQRGAIYARAVSFFERFDLLVCPAACVAPFPVDIRWLRELNGVGFDNYVEWLRITSAITLTSCPAISVPCGFTSEGLPVGLQLVGRPRGESALLAAAAAFEQVSGVADKAPPDPAG